MQHTQQQDKKSRCQGQSRTLVEDARRRDWDDFLYLHRISPFCHPHLYCHPWKVWAEGARYSITMMLLETSTRTSQSYLRHTSCGDLARTQLTSRILTILVKVSLLSLLSESHKCRPLVTMCGSDLPKEALLRWPATDFPEFSKMFTFLLYFPHSPWRPPPTNCSRPFVSLRSNATRCLKTGVPESDKTHVMTSYVTVDKSLIFSGLQFPHP